MKITYCLVSNTVSISALFHQGLASIWLYGGDNAHLRLKKNLELCTLWLANIKHIIEKLTIKF